MKLSIPETQLEDLLKSYSAEQFDWPESQEKLDQFILAGSHADEEYDRHQRVAEIVGLISAARNAENSPRPGARMQQRVFFDTETADESQRPSRCCRSQSLHALFDIVRDAYLDVFDGCSTDLLIADPDRNCLFVQACWSRGAQASQAELNHLLLNARKRKLIGKVDGVERYNVCSDVLDCYLFASEVALRILQDKAYFEEHRTISLDRILCDPKLGAQFVSLAQRITPGFRPVDYRWAAFRLRKACNRGDYAKGVRGPAFRRLGTRNEIRASKIDNDAGFFWMKFEQSNLFIGHTENLRRQIDRILGMNFNEFLPPTGIFESLEAKQIEFAIAPFRGFSSSDREPFKTGLIRSETPRMNLVSHIGDAA